MENKEEKTLNYLFERLTEIYYLKGVCLTILKDLEAKKKLSKKEQYWKNELISTLFNQESI